MGLIELIIILFILAFFFGGPRAYPAGGNIFYTLCVVLVLVLLLRLLGVWV